MQYQLQVFHDDKHEEFRTIEIDGEPWFVGVDVCRALDIKNPSDAYSRLDSEDLGTAEALDRRGVKQPFRIVNEAGLYALIFQSRRPEAQRFKKWVTSEVLPSIRRTGGYGRTAVVPAQWQPFLERIESLNGAVPEGYFSIFNEMATLVKEMIVAGISVDHHLVPDISIGIPWSKVWQETGYEGDYGARVRYPHSYPLSFPQSASNPQWSFAYPEDALPVFRRWFRAVYLKQDLPRYLHGKAAKGLIPKQTADAALVAVGAIERAHEPVKLPS